jgi:cytochrome o ubiquinol oxidase subunit IV
MKSTLTSYVTGYALSLVLTLGMFGLVALHFATGHRFPTHEFLYIALVVSALLQLFVQLYFFFHLGRGSSRSWNIAAMCFAGIVVCILVGGTLWIMYNLQAGSLQSMFQNGIITPQNEED